MVCHMLLTLLISCAPIAAPEGFDDLNSFLFENFHERSKVVEAGVENLYAWLPENEQALEDGYRVENLSAAAIESVEQAPPDQLIGIATSLDIPYSVDEIAYAQFAIDPEDLSPDTDGYNDRSFITDPDCFLDHSCELIQYQSKVKTLLPLNIEVVTSIFSEARWVDTEWGSAYIQRRYITEDTEISVDWVSVDSEYGFIITLPQENGTTKRIEAMWVNMTMNDMPVPENLATQLALGALKDSIMTTTTYLDENQ